MGREKNLQAWLRDHGQQRLREPYGRQDRIGSHAEHKKRPTMGAISTQSGARFLDEAVGELGLLEKISRRSGAVLDG